MWQTSALQSAWGWWQSDSTAETVAALVVVGAVVVPVLVAWKGRGGDRRTRR